MELHEKLIKRIAGEQVEVLKKKDDPATGEQVEVLKKKDLDPAMDEQVVKKRRIRLREHSMTGTKLIESRLRETGT